MNKLSLQPDFIPYDKGQYPEQLNLFSPEFKEGDVVYWDGFVDLKEYPFAKSTYNAGEAFGTIFSVHGPKDGDNYTLQVTQGYTTRYWKVLGVNLTIARTVPLQKADIQVGIFVRVKSNGFVFGVTSKNIGTLYSAKASELNTWELLVK